MSEAHLYRLLTTLIDQQPVQETVEQPYINRELSWLEFNLRVLGEARNVENPLFERLNFLAITCSNLDEFFMVRAGSLHELSRVSPQSTDITGMTAREQLEEIVNYVKYFNKKQYSTYHRQLLPALAKVGIHIVRSEQLTITQREYLADYFQEEIFPVLTPIAVDSSRPFPLIANRSIYLYVGFEESEEITGFDDYRPFALIQIPQVLPRLIRLNEAPNTFILLEDVIKLFIGEMFPHLTVRETVCFRITRNADFAIEEDEIDDLLVEIEDKLKLRRRGEVIRLEIDKKVSNEVQELFVDLLGKPDAIIKIKGPLDLKFVSQLPALYRSFNGEQVLNFAPFTPSVPPELVDFLEREPSAIFAEIARGDILLHHPYQSFDSVVRLIEQAAADPRVLAIKQTLYRVSGNSPIIGALIKAAEQGKQVLVLVELKARFDESNNIHWARRLERAGCHVIYGVKKLKTHSKITLIVRREETGIRRYVHLGTGNYNDQTAKLYTDLGLLTCRDDIGEDATAFFNMLSGYTVPESWRQLVPAPRLLKNRLIQLLDREIRYAQRGERSYVIAKMNSLSDREMIDKLYAASQAGVKILLIVRGICCLRPGVKNLSENIRIHSIVGRFLEHSRIFYFYNNGEPRIFLSSADWMTRNLSRRVELMFPVDSPACRSRIEDILALQMSDTERAHRLKSDGSYERIDRRGRVRLDSQNVMIKQMMENEYE